MDTWNLQQELLALGLPSELAAAVADDQPDPDEAEERLLAAWLEGD